MKMTEPKNREDARQKAIQWQSWASEQSLSNGELAIWQDHFHTVALKFELVDEFQENGII